MQAKQLQKKAGHIVSCRHIHGPCRHSGALDAFSRYSTVAPREPIISNKATACVDRASRALSPTQLYSHSGQVYDLELAVTESYTGYLTAMNTSNFVNLHSPYANGGRIPLLLQLALRPPTGVHCPQKVVYVD